MIAPDFDGRDGAKATAQSSSFGHITIHHLNHREDTPPKPTPSTYIPHPHSLEQKSLSIWVYLAVAFILLAVTTVFAYLLYTCYHSGKSRERRNMATWPRVPRLGSNGNMARLDDDKVSDVGDRKQSESEANMIRLSRPTASQSSLSDIGRAFFDLECNYPSSSSPARTKEGSATCIPFRLALPPPSPSPEYKQQIERQRSYRGRMQLSPTSPPPSIHLIPSSPPITSGLGGLRRGSDKFSAVGFDSNDIELAPPPNPFMTPSTALLWNDPKLSPIQGWFVTTRHNTDDGLSTPESSFNRGTFPGSPRL